MLINSCAKINLYLDVLKKRPDGYHEVDTLFSTVSLHDSLKFVLTKKPEIKILSNIQELASANNLVYRITKRIFEEFSVSDGIIIYLNKRIPVSAGLGGGSSNAAMTILALNKLFNLSMEKGYIQNLAAEYGSDINFFLVGGLAQGKSRGEEVIPLPDQKPLDLLLVNPNLKVSSKEAYDLIDWKVKERSELKLWFNRLESGIKNKYPIINGLITDLKEMGACEAIMSGSGSTCIGHFDSRAKQDAAALYFKHRNFWTKAVKTIGRSKYQECFLNLS